MIQRKQTLWLFLCAACAFTSLTIPFYAGNVQNGKADLVQYHELNGMENIWLIILTIAVAVLSITNIFLFKQRKLQQRFVWIILLIEVILVLVYCKLTKQFQNGSYSIGAILQPLIILSLIMALSGIRKDERIISESDRLR